MEDARQPPRLQFDEGFFIAVRRTRAMGNPLRAGRHEYPNSRQALRNSYLRGTLPFDLVTFRRRGLKVSDHRSIMDSIDARSVDVRD